MYTIKHILCKKCHLPEIGDDGVCKACGYSSSKHSSSTCDNLDNKNVYTQPVPPSLWEQEISHLINRIYSNKDKCKSQYIIVLNTLIDTLFNCDQASWESNKNKYTEMVNNIIE